MGTPASTPTPPPPHPTHPMAPPSAPGSRREWEEGEELDTDGVLKHRAGRAEPEGTRPSRPHPTPPHPTLHPPTHPPRHLLRSAVPEECDLLGHWLSEGEQVLNAATVFYFLDLEGVVLSLQAEQLRGDTRMATPQLSPKCKRQYRRGRPPVHSPAFFDYKDMNSKVQDAQPEPASVFGRGEGSQLTCSRSSNRNTLASLRAFWSSRTWAIHMQQPPRIDACIRETLCCGRGARGRAGAGGTSRRFQTGCNGRSRSMCGRGSWAGGQERFAAPHLLLSHFQLPLDASDLLMCVLSEWAMEGVPGTAMG
jgi:hypothetical protein